MKLNNKIVTTFLILSIVATLAIGGKGLSKLLKKGIFMMGTKFVPMPLPIPIPIPMVQDQHHHIPCDAKSEPIVTHSSSSTHEMGEMGGTGMGHLLGGMGGGMGGGMNMGW